MFLTVRKFNGEDEVRRYLLELGNSDVGSRILSLKSETLTVEIDGIDTRAANILKQDAISVGADCAVPRKASSFEKGTCRVLLMGNRRSIKKLTEKLKLQPFRLSELSRRLERLMENYFKNRFTLNIGRRKLVLDKPLIMGILNVTPDSFSDGGFYTRIETAVRHAEEMVREGASIVDVGGESTRPGSEPIPADEEMGRVIPVIESIRDVLGDEVVISIDTYKSEVAREALKAGADMVNDISGLHFDERMAEVVSGFKCPVVITHIKGTPKNMQENPHYEDVVREIMNYLSETVEYARGMGIGDDQIVIDPGIGFGKRVEDNLCILRRLNEFRALGFPILIGTSRKSFIGKVNAEPDPRRRLSGTLATLYASVIRGAKILRVHDVKETKRFLDMLTAIEEIEC